MSELQKKRREEHEIDLGRLAKALLRWSWLLAAVAIVFGLVSYIYSANMIAPTYRASFTAYVLSRESSEDEREVSVGELNASIGLAYAYGDIIRSRSVLGEAAKQSKYVISYGELAGKVSISASETTAILTVHVEDTDKLRAYDLACAIAKIAPGRVKEVTGGGTMNILDEPVVPGGQHTPNNKQNALLGAVIGFLLAAVFVIVREMVNDKVNNTQELEQRYQIAIIGAIPDLKQSAKSTKTRKLSTRGGRS